MSRIYKRGFTLIELLVVVAIIGILSGVVLASLNSARTKGADAGVKSNISTIQAQAEIDYDGTFSGSYGTIATAGTCPSASAASPVSIFDEKIVWNALKKALDASNSSLTSTGVFCNAGGTGSGQFWVVQVPLKSSGYWCADSTGFVGAEAAVAASGATKCL